MKLKTLKDLKYGDPYADVWFERELKQEAIKWINADCDFHDWRLLFKKFFNITEDDLK